MISAKTRLETAKNKWGIVRGPVAATIMTAQRIGWTFVDAHTLQNDEGMVLDLTRDSPVFVAQQVTSSVRRFLAKEIEKDLPTLGANKAGPISSGLKKAMKSRRKLQQIHKNCHKKCKPALRSAVQ